MVNKNEFRSVMIRHGENQSDVAKWLGMSVANLSKKLNGNGDWTVAQIMCVKKRYDLSPEDIDRIFFSSECS